MVAHSNHTALADASVMRCRRCGTHTALADASAFLCFLVYAANRCSITRLMVKRFSISGMLVEFFYEEPIS